MPAAGFRLTVLCLVECNSRTRRTAAKWLNVQTRCPVRPGSVNGTNSCHSAPAWERVEVPLFVVGQR
jgi:hypothetical protein